MSMMIMVLSARVGGETLQTTPICPRGRNLKWRPDQSTVSTKSLHGDEVCDNGQWQYVAVGFFLTKNVITNKHLILSGGQSTVSTKSLHGDEDCDNGQW